MYGVIMQLKDGSNGSNKDFNQWCFSKITNQLLSPSDATQKNKKSSKLYITFAGECLKILNNIKKSKKIPLKKETYFTKRLSKNIYFVYNKYNNKPLINKKSIISSWNCISQRFWTIGYHREILQAFFDMEISERGTEKGACA